MGTSELNFSFALYFQPFTKAKAKVDEDYSR